MSKYQESYYIKQDIENPEAGRVVLIALTDELHDLKQNNNGILGYDVRLITEGSSLHHNLAATHGGEAELTSIMGSPPFVYAEIIWEATDSANPPESMKSLMQKHYMQVADPQTPPKSA